MQSPYFGVKVGAVTEDQIKKYIENQSDEPGSFKVWDERAATEAGTLATQFNKAKLTYQKKS